MLQSINTDTRGLMQEFVASEIWYPSTGLIFDVMDRPRRFLFFVTRESRKSCNSYVTDKFANNFSPSSSNRTAVSRIGFSLTYDFIYSLTSTDIDTILFPKFLV